MESTPINKIKNARLESTEYVIESANTNPNSLTLCSSELISADGDDIAADDDVLIYSNDNIFSDGTNVPHLDSNRVTTQVNVCPF